MLTATANAYAAGDETFNEQNSFDPGGVIGEVLGLQDVPFTVEDESPGGQSVSLYLDAEGNVVSGLADLPTWKVDINCSTFWSRGRSYLGGLIVVTIPYVHCTIYFHKAQYIDKNRDGRIGAGDMVQWWMQANKGGTSTGTYQSKDTGLAANAAVKEALADFVANHGSSGDGNINLE